MTCGIYMIKNKVNGKMYIGQSVYIEKRWRDHKECLRGNQNKPNKHLQSAWNKYGEDNFEFTIICECDESQLDTMEIDYIAKLNTYDPDFGYNKTYGGGGSRATEETKEKMSEAQKGKNNPMYGKHHSEEAKRKLSEAHKGKTLSEETKTKISEAHKGENNPFYGKQHSEESKRKMSAAQKGRTFSEEHKKNLSESLKGRPFSEEHKRKIRENHASVKGKNNPMYGKLGAKNPSSIPVVQLTLDGELVNIYGSAHEAERSGFNNSSISQCCKGRVKTHKDCKWQYLSYYISQIDPRIKKVILFGKEYEF